MNSPPLSPRSKGRDSGYAKGWDDQAAIASKTVRTKHGKHIQDGEKQKEHEVLYQQLVDG
eukprot:gene1479-12599_t